MTMFLCLLAYLKPPIKVCEPYNQEKRLFLFRRTQTRRHGVTSPFGEFRERILLAYRGLLRVWHLLYR